MAEPSEIRSRFKWYIPRFSVVYKMSVLESSRFAFLGAIWQLRMYSNSSYSNNRNESEHRFNGNHPERTHISLFLVCHNAVSKQIGWELRIENLSNIEKSIRSYRREFCFKEGLSRGYNRFCNTQRLLKSENGFLDESGGLAVIAVLDLSLFQRFDDIPCDNIFDINRVFKKATSVAKNKEKHGALSLKQISNFRKNDLHTDFEIKGKRYSIRVHKVIVSSCSGFFDAMLNPMIPWRENAEQSVYLKSIDEPIMNAVIAFMYDEKDFLEHIYADVKLDETPSLLSTKPKTRKKQPKQKINPLLKLLLAADHLLISRLVDICEKRVEQSLTVENVLKVLEAIAPIYVKDVKDFERKIIAAEDLERKTIAEPPSNESELFCAESLKLDRKPPSETKSLSKSSSLGGRSLGALDGTYSDETVSRKKLRDNGWGDKPNLIHAVFDFAVTFLDQLLRQNAFVDFTTRKPGLSNLLMRKSRLRSDYTGKVFIERIVG